MVPPCADLHRDDVARVHFEDRLQLEPWRRPHKLFAQRTAQRDLFERLAAQPFAVDARRPRTLCFGRSQRNAEFAQQRFGCAGGRLIDHDTDARAKPARDSIDEDRCLYDAMNAITEIQRFADTAEGDDHQPVVLRPHYPPVVTDHVGDASQHRPHHAVAALLVVG